MMNYKYLALGIMALVFVYETILHYLETRSAKREIPENVADVYDREEYQRWLNYDGEVNRLSLFRHFVSSTFSFVLIGFDVYAGVVNLLGIKNMYLAAVVVLLADTLIAELWSIPFSYIRNMGIEQKYGFNRMTMKTFVLDEVKNVCISSVLLGGLIVLLTLIHQTLGNWMLIIFSVIVIALILVINCLSPVFTRIFNKLESLEEGDLRTRLMELLTSNDCEVHDIYITDGSRRSTKANAYFGGLGKLKTIVLYDTLVQQMTEDEILAVFAHEMGHNKHKDVLKLMGESILNIVLWVILLWGIVSVEGIYGSFGFDGVNYGFAFVLLANVCLSVLNPVLTLLRVGSSRKKEYAADRFAAEQGYGEALISALKKLTKNNFACLNPHPIIVKLTYSHPTVSQRVEALEKN